SGGKCAEYRQQVPQEIQIAGPFVEMAGARIADISHLRVEVVMVIPLPRRQRTRVCGPNPLQRHRWRAAAGSSAVEIAHEIVFPEHGRFGNRDGGLLPESV